MTPILTTITPCWNRPEMLLVWLRSIEAAAMPEVRHILLLIEDEVSSWIKQYENDNLRVELLRDTTPKSIGHYHNVGAAMAETEWIMKLDVDCVVHTQYFRELIPMLHHAAPRQWFNGGMFYIDRTGTNGKLTPGRLPVTCHGYEDLIQQHSKFPTPAGTNFICRRRDYLDLGGCDPGFEGYGWEDYQQIYMLEWHQLGQDPLPGPVDEGNVTFRCRDEISRRKALELWQQNERLGLLHRWHPPGGGAYKNPLQTARNRKVLLNYIMQRRSV